MVFYVRLDGEATGGHGKPRDATVKLLENLLKATVVGRAQSQFQNNTKSLRELVESSMWAHVDPYGPVYNLMLLSYELCKFFIVFIIFLWFYTWMLRLLTHF